MRGSYKALGTLIATRAYAAGGRKVRNHLSSIGLNPNGYGWTAAGDQHRWRVRMRLGVITFLTCIVASCFMAAEPVQACTCSAPASAAEAFKRSAAVFRGRVIEISRPLFDRMGLTKTGNHRVKFEVLKRWKGASSKSTVVITRLTGEACGFPFVDGKEYLVYVVTEPRDIQTGICTGTKTIADAESEMTQLDELRARSQ